jgi:hypothetical protein
VTAVTLLKAVVIVPAVGVQQLALKVTPEKVDEAWILSKLWYVMTVPPVIEFPLRVIAAPGEAVVMLWLNLAAPAAVAAVRLIPGIAMPVRVPLENVAVIPPLGAVTIAAASVPELSRVTTIPLAEVRAVPLANVRVNVPVSPVPGKVPHVGEPVESVSTCPPVHVAADPEKLHPGDDP